jgi:23S rRNA (guanine2535-N1)-methyltransferase
MQYKYAKTLLDYSDLASGRVFHSLPGHPAFPVRLASEIFQRCIVGREKIYNNSDPCILYDPCCGTAYHLSVLAYLHGENIRAVIGSDIDAKAVAIAKRNLELLTVAGLDQRIAEISQLFELYGKDSHRDALRSGYTLRNNISALTQEEHPIATKVFQASATDVKAIIKNIEPNSVDIVFTDVPYGQHSHWKGSNHNELSNPLWSMLNGLISILSPASIVAIVSDKQQKVSHESFQRLEQFQIGKRRVVILKPV